MVKASKIKSEVKKELDKLPLIFRGFADSENTPTSMVSKKIKNSKKKYIQDAMPFYKAISRCINNLKL